VRRPGRRRGRLAEGPGAVRRSSPPLSTTRPRRSTGSSAGSVAGRERTRQVGRSSSRSLDWA
jgi:hypothetical protein